MAEIEMTIDSIRVSLMNYQRNLILKDKSSDHYLTIGIGQAEADAIASKLQKIPVTRPLTHDFICSLITALGGSVTSVIINKFENDTYYAQARIRRGDEMLQLDCRPSDAIAIAIRLGMPIFADEEGCDKVFIKVKPET
jgi:uncharacterized protein